MSGAVAVQPVTTRRQRRRFIDLPYRMHRRTPNWVPPLRSGIKSVLDPDHPFYEHAEIDLYLATRGGRPVGRIAAVHNRGYNDYTGERVAFFGFFDSEDDPETAAALFDAVRRFGRDRGLAELRGPVSPSMHAECGLLIDAFDLPPVVMMPYNPPYYPRLFEQSGLAKCKDLYAYRILRDDVMTRNSPLARLERMEGQIAKRFPSFRIRTLDMTRYEEEVIAFGRVFNEARQHNFGFSPMTDAELRRLAADLRPVANPNLCLAAEYEGEIIGAGLGLPDLNRVLIHLNGRLLPFGFLRLMWGLRRPHGVRVFGIAAKPEHRRKGVAGLLMLELIRRAYRAGFVEAEAGWVNEDNDMSNRTIMALLCAERYKTYRIYTQALE